MKVTGSRFATSVGAFFIALALIATALVLPSAKGSQSPFLYRCIFGGLFIGIPAVLGIGIVFENLRNRSRVRAKSDR